MDAGEKSLQCCKNLPDPKKLGIIVAQTLLWKNDDKDY